MAKGKQWQRLTAERKFRIFLETWMAEAPVGEILRTYGLTPEELRVIEEAFESAAIAGLKVRAGHRKHPAPASPGEYERVCQELREKEWTLAELTVGYTLLKKNDRWGALAGRRGRALIASEGREASLMAVREAQAGGVSPKQAARVIGLSARTIQR